jgi:hypothetical protein
VYNLPNLKMTKSWREKSQSNRCHTHCFKGIVSPRIKRVLFALMVFIILYLGVFLWRTSNIKFLLDSMKLLIICENPYSSLLQEACSVRIAACDSPKVVSKAAFDPEIICSESRPWIYTGENRLMSEKESRNRDTSTLHPAAFFGINKCFQRSKQKFNIYFSL